MKRQPELEQIHRLSVKTLDQVFVTRSPSSALCCQRIPNIGGYTLLHKMLHQTRSVIRQPGRAMTARSGQERNDILVP